MRYVSIRRVLFSFSLIWPNGKKELFNKHYSLSLGYLVYVYVVIFLRLSIELIAGLVIQSQQLAVGRKECKLKRINN